MTWHHSSYSESDDAESGYKEYEFQSPISNISHDDADLSILIGENSPGGSSVVEENFGPSENLFKLDPGEPDEAAVRSVTSVKTFLAEPTHSPNSCTIFNDNCRFTGVCHSKSLPSSHEHRVDLDARTCFANTEEMNWPSNTPKTGTKSHNFGVGYMLGYASSVGDSPYESNSLRISSAKELLKSQTSNGFILQNNTMACVAPTGTAQILTWPSEDSDTVEFNCMLKLDGGPQKNSRCMLEFNDGIGFPDMACENRRPEAFVVKTEGKTGGASSASGNTSLGNSLELQSGSSDPILQNINNGNFVFHETRADNTSSLYIETANLDLRHLKCQLQCESTNEVGEEAEVSSTANLKSISGIAASVVCGNSSDRSNDCSALSLQFPESQPSERKQQSTLAHENTMNKLTDNVNLNVIVTSDLAELDLNAKNENVMPRNLCGQNVGTADLYGSPICWLDPQAPLELDMSKDHFTSGTCQQYSDGENEDMDCTRYFSSVIDRDPYSLEIQNLLDCNHIDPSHVDSVSSRPCISKLAVEYRESTRKDPLRNVYYNHFDSSSLIVAGSFYDCGTACNKNNNFPSTLLEESNGHGTSVTNASSHDVFPTQTSSCITEASKGRRGLDFGELILEDREVASAVEEQVWDLNDPGTSSSSTDYFGNVNISCEDKDMTLEKQEVDDSKSCSCSMGCLKHNTLNNLHVDGDEKQPFVGGSHNITDGEAKTSLVMQNRTYYPGTCDTRKNMLVEIQQDCSKEACTGNSVNYCLRNGGGESINDCANISEVVSKSFSKLNAAADSENSSSAGSSYEDEDSCRPLINTLDGTSRGSNQQTFTSDVDKCALFVEKWPGDTLSADNSCQGQMQKTDFDLSEGSPLLTVCSPESKASLSMQSDHTDQTTTRLLQNGGKGVIVDFKEACSLCASKLEITDDPVHSSDVPMTRSPHFETASAQSQENPTCATAWVLERKRYDTDQSIRTNDHGQPLEDEDEIGLHDDDARCPNCPKKDLENGEIDLMAVVRSDGEEREKVTATPRKKVLLKSFAGGLTVLGALFVLLHVRRKGGRGIIDKNTVRAQSQKMRQEGSSRKDTEESNVGGVYPGGNFKF